jgi:DNA-binding NarL/FixJ family response regulator
MPFTNQRTAKPRAETWVQVAMVDDHPLLVESLSMLLANRGVAVTATFFDGTSAVEGLPNSGAEVALIDVTMPGFDGFEVTRRVKGRMPGLKVLILAAYADEDNVRMAMTAGASGYMVKTSDIEELELAIRAVMAGNQFYSSAITAQMDIGMLQRDAQGQRPIAGMRSLTARELEMVNRLVQGYTVNEISAELGISAKTARGYTTSLMQKLGARNRADVVRIALRSSGGQQQSVGAA